MWRQDTSMIFHTSSLPWSSRVGDWSQNDDTEKIWSKLEPNTDRQDPGYENNFAMVPVTATLDVVVDTANGDEGDLEDVDIINSF